jgi:hypothetical protein
VAFNHITKFVKILPVQNSIRYANICVPKKCLYNKLNQFITVFLNVILIQQVPYCFHECTLGNKVPKSTVWLLLCFTQFSTLYLLFFNIHKTKAWSSALITVSRHDMNTENLKMCTMDIYIMKNAIIFLQNFSKYIYFYNTKMSIFAPKLDMIRNFPPPFW